MEKHDYAAQGRSFERAKEVMTAQVDRKIATYFSSCVHCGICAQACHFHVVTGDPKYTPIHKVEPLRKLWKQEHTFWGKLASKMGLSKPLTEQDLIDWEEFIYDSCTLCGRCTMVCPVGNDITYMIRKAREGMVAGGYAPESLMSATDRAVNIGSPMGVTIKALTAQIGHAERATGLKIPVDVEGAEYLSLLSSMEIMNFPEYLEGLTRIFHEAGVSWTIATDAYEATNSGIQIGDSKVAAFLVERVVKAAERLKVKYVISPECGHAYTAIRWEGANLIGRPLPFKVVHILELLDQLRTEGRIKTQGKTDTRLTFHDPCQIVRRGGVVEPPRNLLKGVASNYVEMPDAGVMNWCCGAGGGVSANERAHELKIKAFDRKIQQLEGLDVQQIVTSCANCRLNMEEGLEENEMDADIEVIGVTELVAEYLVESRAQAKGTEGQ